MRSLSFSWSAIADILMVSRMTLYRRKVEFGLLDEPSSVIGEEDLLSIALNRNTPPTEAHQLSPGGSQRINYSFVPGGYKIYHCPGEIAAVCDCPGGVRAFYNTLDLYKFAVQGRGLS